jgi:hypothetical protein
MSRKDLKKVYRPYRGSVRGTWREGSYTEDSERHVLEAYGKEAFL